MEQSLFPADDTLGLCTDFYELTMAAAYHVQGMGRQQATFELWVRRLPRNRNFLVAAGLEQVVHYLRNLRFTNDQVAYLKRHPMMDTVPAEWFEELKNLRFEGDLWAVPEGTIVFAGEPLLRVTAPLQVAQIVETYLITTMTAQTMIASKAARVCAAARGRPVVDFGARRAHGPQAGFLAARAGFIGGLAGTSYVEAARRLGIPAVGTQAHAWIMAHEQETEAFRKFGEVFPHATLLIDTYDTVQGAKNALASGARFEAVRLDSGDLGDLSKQVRRVLDAAGRSDVKIVASGDLNETKIHHLRADGAPIDQFGVGTELVTSRDDPTLSTVYKLVEQETATGTRGRMKLSADKKTYPFAKQIDRQRGPTGYFQRDLLVRAGTSLAGTPLLVPILKEGKLVEPMPSLVEIQHRFLEQRKQFTPELFELGPAEPYRVEISPELEALAQRMHPQPHSGPED